MGRDWAGCPFVQSMGFPICSSPRRRNVCVLECSKSWSRYGFGTVVNWEVETKLYLYTGMVICGHSFYMLLGSSVPLQPLRA